MFGGFMRGIVGAGLPLVAVVLFFILVGNGAPAGVVIIVCGGLFFGGAYLRYVSRNTVRTRH